MDLTHSQSDQEFLLEVARLEAEGLQMKEIAKRVSIAPGTLTYRLARLGYGNKNQLVDLRTGTPLAELLPREESATDEAVAA